MMPSSRELIDSLLHWQREVSGELDELRTLDRVEAAPVFNVQARGAHADGTTDDSSAIAGAIEAARDAGGGTVTLPKATYNASGGISVSDLNDVAIVAPEGATIEGSLTVTATTGSSEEITAGAARGDKTIAVVDGSTFTAGDTVIITASDEEDNNSVAGKDPQQEVNEVTAISSNTLTLKYPLAHSYEFDAGFTNQATVAIATNGANQNVIIEGIEFDSGSVLQVSACRNLQLSKVRTNNTIGSGASPNQNVRLIGVVSAAIDVTTIGGKDGVRINGCADMGGNVTVHEADERAVRLYKCDNVSIRPTVVGSQTQTGNLELLLLDYSYDCEFVGAYVNEPNKTSLASLCEFRYTERCTLRDSVALHMYAALNVNVKERALHSRVLNNRAVFHGSANHFVVLNAEGDAPVDNTLVVAGNDITSEQSTVDVTLLRITGDIGTSSSNAFAFVRLADNTFPRGAGHFYSSGESASSEGVALVVMVDNTSTGGDGTSGSFMSSAAIIDTLVVDNCHMATPGNRRLDLSDVSNAYLSNSRIGELNSVTWANVHRLSGMNYNVGTADEPNTLANVLALTDGVTAPAAISGLALLYVDTSDGDLKVIFGNGTVKTIVVDT